MKFHASVVCTGKLVWFLVNVKVCSSIMVIRVGNRQIEIDLNKHYLGI